jgi:hypothetical protein
VFPCGRARARLRIGFPFQGCEEDIVTVGALHFASSTNATRLLLIASNMAVATLFASCLRVNMRANVKVWA